MSEMIETPPRRNLNLRSKRLLLHVVDSWSSSEVPLRFTRGVDELTDAGLVEDDDGDLRPTERGIDFSRTWLDLEGYQQRRRAKVLSLVANGPVPVSDAQDVSLGFAYRWLLRSGEIARYPRLEGHTNDRYGLPETDGDPTQSRAWSRLLASGTLKYTPSLNGLLAAGLAYQADWEGNRPPVRLTERGKQKVLWERPGGCLLRKILPAWRAATTKGAVDDFLGRQLASVVDVLETWIARDARRSSKAAIPDTRLHESLLVAATGDPEDLIALARLTLSDYWAMDALRARGADAHADGAKLVTDALVAARAREGGGDRETLLAVQGKPPGGWRPPVYRRKAPPEVPTKPRRSEEPRIAVSLGIDESERAAREGLDEASLVVFDILVELKGDTLDGAARTRVKEVARALLDLVNLEISRIHAWTEKRQTKAQIKVLIHDFLYRGDDTGLPEVYLNEEIDELAEALYRHFYERSVSAQTESELDEELRDLIDDEVVDVLKMSPHTFDSLVQAMAPATRTQVGESLVRLLDPPRRVWRLAKHGEAALYAHVSVGIGSYRPPQSGENSRSTGLLTPEEVHGEAIRADAKRLGEAAYGRYGFLDLKQATDVLRPDADGRRLAYALLDLTDPERSAEEVHSYLQNHKFSQAAEHVWQAQQSNLHPQYLRDQVWKAIFRQGEHLTRVQGTTKLHVRRAAIREDAPPREPWVAVRRVVDSRVWLERVKVEIVQHRNGGSTWIKPLVSGELESGDEVHLSGRLTPEALFELYTVLGHFLDDFKYKPVDLADVRKLLLCDGGQDQR